jgi:site-specific recombinase XerD
VFDKNNNVKGLVINRYKLNALRKYGRYVIEDLPKKLSKSLSSYKNSSKLVGNDFLFPSNKGNDVGLTEDNFSRFVSNMFRRYSMIATDVNMLRHSFASNFFSKYNSITAVKETAKKMGTSASELANYVRRELLEEVFSDYDSQSDSESD